MDSLIVYLDKSDLNVKLKSALKMIKGIVSISGKIIHSDFEELADDVLTKVIRNAEKDPLPWYEDKKKNSHFLRNG